MYAGLLILKPMDDEQTKRLRKRLKRWHYRKAKGLGVIDLLDSNYQGFRYRVQARLDRPIGFIEALNLANADELQQLDNYILEERLGI